MMRAGALITVLALAGCDETQRAVDSAARETAKRAVIETLATRFPAVPRQAVTPFTDCAIENASAGEIRDLASAAVVGVTDETATLVGNILSRPETQQCIARAGASVLTV